MTIRDLFKLHLGDSINIFHKPFVYVGHAEIDLDNGKRMRWIYDDEGSVLSVAPEDEELILFKDIEEELEPDDDTIVFHGKDFEFETEVNGNVVNIEGESVAEEDEHYILTDYQSPDSEVVRVASNENNGDNLMYFGKYVTEDDIAEV